METFKTYKELEEAYWENYVSLEYSNTTGDHDLDEVSYHLFDDTQEIVQISRAGDIACGCDACYVESTKVVAYVDKIRAF